MQSRFHRPQGRAWIVKAQRATPHWVQKNQDWEDDGFHWREALIKMCSVAQPRSAHTHMYTHAKGHTITHMQTYDRHTVSQIAQTHTHAYSKTQICSVSHSDTPSQEAQAWPTLSSCHSFLSPDPFKLSPSCPFYPTSSYTNIPEGTSQCLPLMTIPPNHETPPPH